MNAKTRKIDEINKLEKRINAWGRLADLTRKISRYADAKRYVYTYEQTALIDEVRSETQAVDLRAREEYNRQRFEFDL